ncbi:MAG: Y-family DNA polymerase [Muribaculaceae bacterium]
MDCNNFFVSCERVFNPALNGQPVVVLSGNDGCVIARSNEAKELGIPMGIPAFKVSDIFAKYNVITFSGNMELYNDMSRRIMALLAQEVEDVDVYSIDESFFTIEDESIEKIQNFIEQLAKKIYRCVGVPVSIGASTTRTLAKIASHIAKKERVNTTRSYVLYSREDVHNRLKQLPVNEVWGIGRRITQTLSEYNIITAFDFINLPKHWVKSRFSITGERTWLELHGMSCATIQSVDDVRQSITVSRSFGSVTHDYTTLSEAVATFTTTCAIKLRKYNLVSGAITIFISSGEQYSNSNFTKISFPTASTIEIVKYAMALLHSIYVDKYSYKKAGVILSDLKDDSNLQLELFHATDEGKHKRLMAAIDRINESSRVAKVNLAASGTEKVWYPKELHKSRAFSTRLQDILIVKCK